tara:strand:+ start:3057 stop:3347 length:291 start_codon:yes stop_codon:yes gene_type:complete
MSYWSDYYKKNAEKIKEKQRNRYASLNEEEKKILLDSFKERRNEESDRERKLRLKKQKERYTKNREVRLAYQKDYNKKKNDRLKELEEKIKNYEQT